MFLVITGNPVNGLFFYGPFDTSEEASKWAEGITYTDWWVAPLGTKER